MAQLKPLVAFAAGVAVVGGLWLLSSRDRADGGRPAGPPPGASSSDFGRGVGEFVADFEFEAIDGRSGRLSELLEGAPAVVVVMRDAACPVCRRYGPKLGRLEEEYAGVPFLYLNVNPEDDASRVRSEELADFGFEGPYVLDPDARAARFLGPRSTTEVFLIDGARTLRYRGAVDDQYGIDFAKPKPRERYLVDALDAVLAGQEVGVTESFPSGCLLGEDGGGMVSTAAAREITWHNRVSRVLQENCVTCHRDGGVAPFSLEEYGNANAYRAMIAFMVGGDRMPPWFAGSASTGTFANERRLSARDRADLLAWIEAGAPEGDPAHAPLPKSFVPGWNIGRPDAVVQIEEPIEIPAEGVVDYKYVYVKTDFEEDRWVRRMQIRPTAPQVTHHVLVFIEPPGARSARRAAPGEPVFQGGTEGYFASYVPGSLGNVYPEGTAKRLPKGAWLKFQLHYTPNGTPGVDRTMIGFDFADEPPADSVITHSAYNTRIRIPAGAPDHREVAEYTFEESGRLLTLLPHMHLRGKAFRYELIYPDGASETILDVPRYDFNWQIDYRLEEPRPVPAGTVVRATAWFDNSPGNPYNPDPSREVRFGEQTFDEMLIGYFDWIPDRAGVAATSEGSQR